MLDETLRQIDPQSHETRRRYCTNAPVLWRPGTEAPEPVKLDTAVEGLLTDRSSSASFEIAAACSTLVGSDGTAIRRFDGLRFGTFSPSGEWVAVTNDKTLSVWDVDSDVAVSLNLPTDLRVGRSTLVRSRRPGRRERSVDLRQRA